MISKITGTVTGKKEGTFYINTGKMSYEVLVPLAVMKAIERSGFAGEVTFVTYHYYQMGPSSAVPVLIGFQNEVEKEFFEKFITVSGVGPKAACRALAEPFSMIAGAIDAGDAAFLKRLPGIGEQRARLIVAKLQGKVGKYGLIQDQSRAAKPAGPAGIEEEAIDVLLQLQYKRSEAENMVRKAVERSSGVATSEELLNEVYRERRDG